MLQSWAWGEAGAGEPGEHWARLVVVDGGGHIRGAGPGARPRHLLRPHDPVRPARPALGPRGDRCRRGAGTSADRPQGPCARSARASSSSSTRAAPATPRPMPRSGAIFTLGRPARRARPAGADDAPHRPDRPATIRWPAGARMPAPKSRRAVREGTTVTVDRVGDPAVLDAFHAAAGRDLRATGLPHPQP